jgi:amino acid adenylation domain-containing protein
LEEAARMTPSHGACSRGQEAIWFAEQAAEIGAANNLPLAIELIGGLDRDALGQALAAIVRSQPALRTRFAERAGRLTRRELAPDAAAPPEIVAQDTDAVEAAIAARSRIPLDLIAAPYELALFRCGPHRHVLFGNFHHAMFDGTSKDLFALDLAAAYAAAAAGRSPTMQVRESYSAYVALEQRRTEELDSDARRHWEPALGRLRDRLQFPPSPHADPHAPRGEALRFELDHELAGQVRQLARRSNVSMFVALMGAVQLLQHIYASRADGPIATLIPLGTRPPEMRRAIGMFVNEVPLLSLPSRHQRVGDFLGELAVRLREVSRLRAYPFNEAMARFGPADDPHALLPGFSVSYWKSSQPEPDVSGVRVVVDRLLPIYGRRWGARFRFLDRPGRLVAGFEYDTEVLHKEAAWRMVEHLRTLLAAMAVAPDAPLASLSPLPHSERRALVEERNATHEARATVTLQQLIEEQVAQTPERVAVVSGDRRLTYGELNARANRVAHRLVGLGAGPETRVGIYVQRGLELPVAVLAVAKAGAGHVPLDPAYPRDRVAFMLDDSGASIVLTQQALTGELPACDTETVRIDDEVANEASASTDPPVRGGPESLAYVVYTSGSTGLPKGVELVQSAVVNLVQTMIDAPGLSSEDVFLSVTTLSFDIGTVELVAPLSVGATVVIAPPDVATDGRALAELLEHSGATVMFGTPARWQLLVAAGWQGTQKVIVGGEALGRDLAAELLRRSREVWNIYGPTETTVFSTRQRVADAERISIGRPVSNTQLYVLDQVGALTPTGVPGELFIGGAGLARGYLNRPDLTVERFVPNPFGPPDSRLYRTGDLVRSLDNGEIEFLGRVDQQVKVRGFRVEPGEVEAALLRQPGIDRVAVIAREHAPGDRRLVAYLVGSVASPSIRELRGRLGETLPDFMVPSAFVTLAELPLTPNGKLDHQRLPAPAPDGELRDEYLAPRNQTEEILAKVWASVLGVERVGVHDNFFELGGHSLLAAEVIARARSELATDVPPRALFAAPTVAGLARTITAGEDTKASSTSMPRAARRVLADPRAT